MVIFIVTPKNKYLRVYVIFIFWKIKIEKYFYKIEVNKKKKGKKCCSQRWCPGHHYGGDLVVLAATTELPDFFEQFSLWKKIWHIYIYIYIYTLKKNCFVIFEKSFKVCFKMCVSNNKAGHT